MSEGRPLITGARGDVVAHLAILGRHALMPTTQSVVRNGRELLVGHSYSPVLEDGPHGIEIDSSDCTIFTVRHLGYGKEFNVDDAQAAVDLFDESLAAISEVIIWEKAHDQVGEMSSFQRRVGRIDVKVFNIAGERASLVLWKNPLYFTSLDDMAMMAGLLSNVVTRGPTDTPLHPDVKRIMAAIDLVNLGFFTEAFVGTFALLDDLTQRVIAGGLLKKGITGKNQAQFLRSISERRLDHYLNSVAALCDWVALKEADGQLNADLMKANALRNNVMHGDRELTREEAAASILVVVRAIDHLRRNPFGVDVAVFPLLRAAHPELVRLPPPEDPAGAAA
jgi:hypothetical protein